jgi:hypothetical protein
MDKEWNGSKVMEDFVKIAADSGLIVTNFKPEDKDFVGNPSKETPVKDHRRYEPTEEYDVTEKKDLVQAAHPEKIQVADAMGEGGVIENQNEQQEKNLEIATKMPNGALIGIHADLINTLIKVATQLDANGKHKEAIRVDETIERLNSLPFEYSHLYKEAAWGMAIWGIISVVSAVAPYVVDWFRSEKDKKGEKIFKKKKVWDPKGGKGGTGGWKTISKKPVGRFGKASALAGVGLSLLASLGHKVSSIREGIKKDSSDLLEILKKSDNKSALAAANLLKPHVNELLSTDISTKRGFINFEKHVNKMNMFLPQLEKHILTFVELEEPSVLGFGLTLSSRVKEKFSDFKSSLEQAIETITKIRSVGAKANVNAKVALKEGGVLKTKEFSGSNKVEALQNILFNRGFPKGKVWSGNVTGKLDQTTIQAAKELENRLDNILSGFNKEEGLSGSFQNEIISGNKILINPRKLLKILRLSEKYISSKS